MKKQKMSGGQWIKINWKCDSKNIVFDGVNENKMTIFKNGKSNYDSNIFCENNKMEFSKF